ncbi:MAG: cobalamin B12-binding domain-containing protein [Candidatus Aminicenantes bacterium]|nr:MAG: cobalamin B12-binding domain-containing protein [Candidatus Aminicenantes bacterium]
MASVASKKILGASLRNCVHVAGILNFLKLAERYGYETHFLGPAVSLERLNEAIREYDPHMIALSYRLTPEVLNKLLSSFKEDVEKNRWQDKILIFGGTPPTAEVARKTGLFNAVFSGLEPLEELISFLKGKIEEEKKDIIPPQNLIERIEFKAPYPLLRHHFGQPTVEDTVGGAKEIALSQTLDIISIGPDQNAQESFFRPDEMTKEQDGAGGVPLRKAEDLEAIYKATRCGNYPLLRCYSGTRDLIQWADMSLQTINIAWGAVPLFWYNQLDGRSDRTLIESITENQKAMNWYAEHNLPLEINESHHWSLRDAPDTVAVAAAFLAAYNAKEMGITYYVAQYMFNTPSQTSPIMDLAKMLAKIELIESLHDKNFTTIRQMRTGLASLSPDPDVAKGQLSSSCLFQMALEPRIIHVVGFSEGDHAATAADVIESAKITQGVIKNFFLGPPQMLEDSKLKDRKEVLAKEAKYLLQTIKELSSGKVEDPWIDPKTLSQAVQTGLLDAPHLAGRPHAAGKIITQIKDGACYAIDSHTGNSLSEEERISRIIN